MQLRDTKHFAFTAISQDGKTTAFATSGEDVDPVWTHVAGVYDANTQTLSLYVNGVLSETVPFAGAYRAPGPLRVGRAKFGGNPVDFVSGQVDDIQIFQSALSGSQILAIAQPLLGKPGTSAVILPAVLALDTAKIRNRVSPMLYGLMTEEINHSFDGGLYGELLQNRAFRDSETQTPHWTLVEDGGVGTMSLDATQPLSAAIPTSLKLQITSANGRGGVSNDGFWGVPLLPNTRYTASFRARVSPD